MSEDIEIWLLFAPFWLLGTMAALAALWHLVHFIAVHGRALANGHASPLRVRNWSELPAASRHHIRRATYAALAFVGITAVGTAIAVGWALWRSWQGA